LLEKRKNIATIHHDDICPAAVAKYFMPITKQKKHKAVASNPQVSLVMTDKSRPCRFKVL